MSESETTTRRSREPSAAATGGVIFGATMLIIIGVFQFFEGLAAIIDDEFYVVTPNYTYDIDVTGWGWIHLILGAIVALTGLFLLMGNVVAGVVAIFFAGLSAIANFFFIPYFPLWSLLIIALDVFVIWAITRSVFQP